MKIALLFVCFLFILPSEMHAQVTELPFADEIAAFRKSDSFAMPEKGRVLFVGSSSFTMWNDIATAFPGHRVINRGFGGSSLTDVIRYADAVIYPYKPKQVVIYCGENDIAGADAASGRLVFARFRTLFNGIRRNLPGASILYVSMKPSPSRWHMRHRMSEGNRLISAFLATQPRSKYVSVWKAMLGKDGKPLPGIFLEDALHMNEKGYAIWARILEPYLLK